MIKEAQHMKSAVWRRMIKYYNFNLAPKQLEKFQQRRLVYNQAILKRYLDFGLTAKNIDLNYRSFIELEDFNKKKSEYEKLKSGTAERNPLSIFLYALYILNESDSDVNKKIFCSLMEESLLYSNEVNGGLGFKI